MSLSPDETIDILMGKYALINEAIPEFFDFRGVNIDIVKDGDVIEIQNIKNRIKEIPLEEFSSLTRNYRINLDLLVGLYISENRVGLADDDLVENVKIILDRAINVGDVDKLLENYKIFFKNAFEKNSNNLKKHNEIRINLLDYKPHPFVSGVNISEIVIKLEIKKVDDEVFHLNLLNFFNLLQPSYDISFIAIRVKTGSERNGENLIFIKNFEKQKNQSSWIYEFEKSVEETSEDFIFFKMRGMNINEYSTGVIFDLPVVLITHTKNSSSRLSPDTRGAVAVADAGGVFVVSDEISLSSFMKNKFEKFIYPIFSVKTFNIENLKGNFNISEAVINKIVFAEIVTNDDFFSKLFLLNETIKSFSEKKRTFIHLEMDGKKVFLSFKQHEFNEINVKISNVRNVRMIYNAKNVISKFVQFAQGKFEDIKNEYSKVSYKRDFPIPKKKKGVVGGIDRKTAMLKKLKPEMFITGFASKCQKGRQPNYVKGEENVSSVKKMLENDENKLLNFPRGSDEHYYCDDPLYIGLIENQLPNKDKFPFLPCCFGTSKINKKTGAYGKYLGSLESVVPREDIKYVDRITYVVGGDRQVKPYRVGKLPKNVQKFFKTVFPMHNFLRLGLKKSNSDVLHCLNYAKYSRLVYNKMSEGDKEEFAVRRREMLININNKSVLIQNFSGMTISEIDDFIRDKNNFLSPYLVKPILEVVYGYNIIIFDFSDNGSVKQPTLPYFEWDFASKKRKYVFLLAFKDKTELIVKDLPTRLVPAISTSRGESLRIKNIISNTLTLYKMTDPKSSIPSLQMMKLSLKTAKPILKDMISQILDENGRIIGINYNKFSIITPLLPPLLVPTSDKTSLKVVSSPDRMDFIVRKYKLKPISRSENGLVCSSQIGDILIPASQRSILHFDAPGEENNSVDDTYNLLVRDVQETEYEKFKRYNQIFLFLKQFAFKFYHQHGYFKYKVSPGMSFQTLEFSDSFIFDYHNDDKGVRENEDGKKLMVPSDKIGKSLKNLIDVQKLNNEDFIQEVAKQGFVNFDIRSIYDLKFIKDQRIFSSIREYKNWFNSTRFDRLAVENTPRYSYTDPFYYNNNGTILFIQNVKDGNLGRALYVSFIWYNNRVNLGFKSEKELDAVKTKHSVILEDKVITSQKYTVAVLRYQTGEYASILKLEI